MELKRRNFNVMTATVELFQGKEKSVIIVSTVRSGQQGIGFLDNPKVSISGYTFICYISINLYVFNSSASTFYWLEHSR